MEPIIVYRRNTMKREERVVNEKCCSTEKGPNTMAVRTEESQGSDLTWRHLPRHWAIRPECRSSASCSRGTRACAATSSSTCRWRSRPFPST